MGVLILDFIPHAIIMGLLEIKNQSNIVKKLVVVFFNFLSIDPEI